MIPIYPTITSFSGIIIHKFSRAPYPLKICWKRLTNYWRYIEQISPKGVIIYNYSKKLRHFQINHNLQHKGTHTQRNTHTHRGMLYISVVSTEKNKVFPQTISCQSYDGVCSAGQSVYSRLHSHDTEQSDGAVHTKAQAESYRAYQQLKNNNFEPFSTYNIHVSK